jgi:glycosyltransferase EpsD
MRWFREQDWQVDYAADGADKIPDCDKQYNINMARNPFSMKNISAIFKLKKLMEQEKYAIIHCHTPIASVVTRIAAKKIRMEGLKVLYTAHGFHFYTGAPLINWILYYPIEICLSRFTDAIITINQEDFLRAKKINHNIEIYHINGVGVDLQRFHGTNTQRKFDLRADYGYKKDEFLILCVAELNKNKNHICLLKQLKEIILIIPNIKVLFVGTGENQTFIQKFILKNNLEDFVNCLGFRKNVEDYYAISDIFFSASIREGLPVSMIEGMAAGLPIVCSKNRGHNSLVTHNRNGFLFDLKEPEKIVEFIELLYKDVSLQTKIMENNMRDAKQYSLDIAIKNMAIIYHKFM